MTAAGTLFNLQICEMQTAACNTIRICVIFNTKLIGKSMRYNDIRN